MKQILFSVFILLGSISITFGQRTIKGQVTDSAGDAIIGANILVKGDPSIGTITDLEGNF
ncbi:MAG: hypothetical protein H7X99_10025, partial [Saprospiraceae bacterium]|nr:hypothetical protein [Saprospiraceae bacterium]